MQGRILADKVNRLNGQLDWNLDQFFVGQCANGFL
jgi:hypothetical protein